MCFCFCREAKAKDEADRLERCTSSIHAELLEEVTAEMVLQVADQVHQVDVVDRLQLLADLQRAVELKRVSQWLNVWRHVRILFFTVWNMDCLCLCAMARPGLHVCVCVCVRVCVCLLGSVCV